MEKGPNRKIDLWRMRVIHFLFSSPWRFLSFGTAGFQRTPIRFKMTVKATRRERVQHPKTKHESAIIVAEVGIDAGRFSPDRFCLRTQAKSSSSASKYPVSGLSQRLISQSGSRHTWRVGAYLLGTSRASLENHTWK